MALLFGLSSFGLKEARELFNPLIGYDLQTKRYCKEYKDGSVVFITDVEEYDTDRLYNLRMEDLWRE